MSVRRVLRTLVCALPLVTLSTAANSNFLPVGIAVGSAPTTKVSDVSWPLTLSKKGDVATLDFGHEVAGYPFMVATSSKVAQIEAKYAEQFPALAANFSDGPYFFAQGLTNSYRVETFNITGAVRTQSPQIQGGQRWVTLELLTDGPVTFSKAGFVATVSTANVQNLPSSFECSSDLYNSVWELGARAVMTACFEANSQGPAWQLDSRGAYMENQRPSVSISGASSSQYKLSFEAMIARGGVEWSVAQTPGLSLSGGLTFSLTSKLPAGSTFVNANRTLSPANTIVLSYGYPPINQTSVNSYILAEYPVPFEVEEQQWYTIESSLQAAGYVSASIGGRLVFNASLAPFGWAGVSTSPSGSWGFGAGQDQAALVTNVTVTSQNGSTLYQSDLTSTDTLGEYGVASNPVAACLDGAKRDRLIWMGDFYHTSRIIPSSTAAWDQVSGTLQSFADFQTTATSGGTAAIPGLMDIAPTLGYDYKYGHSFGNNAFLMDYQILGFLAYYNYYFTTGDVDTIENLWPAYSAQIDTLLTFIDPTTNLSTVSGFNGPALGSATSSMMVQALNGAAAIAKDLGYGQNSTTYSKAGTRLTNAINKQLWNEKLGAYAISTSAMSDISVMGISLAIISGVASPKRAQQSLATLASELALGPGYKDNSQLTATNSSDSVNAISPNTNGFLLSAAILSNNTAIVKNLLDNLWGAAMVQNNIYYSGASWEYVNNDDLSPGLGLYTSQAHPWGGAPTYVLPEYVVGIRPVTAGYATWSVVPMYTGLNLTYAQASIKTQYGQLTAKWSINGKGKLVIKVSAPAGTSGSVQLPSQKVMGKVNVNGSVKQVGSTLALGSGEHEVEVDI